MKCQDISRLADTSHFGALSATRRIEAEAHANSCSRCAPVWGAHARLAVLHVPPMPAELTLSCRRLAALPVRARSGAALRRLTLIGGLVTLVAAAGILATRIANRPVALTHRSTAPTPPAEQVAPAHSTLRTAALAVRKAADTRQQKPAQAAEALPLIPPPDFERIQKQELRVDPQLALQRAVARHPELVEGPETDGVFAVAMVMKADGSVVDSAARLATQAEIGNVDLALRRTLLPKEGATRVAKLPKSTPLSDGRPLRADTLLSVSTVPDGYDPVRSSTRVEQLVRTRYPGLFLPDNIGEVNLLTIFLNEEGEIAQEAVERVRLEDTAALMSVQSDASRCAGRIAGKLGLDVGRIGLMGFLSIDEGPLTAVVDTDGKSYSRGTLRNLYVSYAWPRRDGEAGPVLRQDGGQKDGDAAPPPFNTAGLLTIVERLIPDAFTVRDPASGIPAIVLNSSGEVLHAGRVYERAADSRSVDDLTWDQLAPGVQSGTHAAIRVTDKDGTTVTVVLAWENPPRSPN